MFVLLHPPFPNDGSELLRCRFRGSVVDVRKCQICGSAAGPKGTGVTIRACSFRAADGSIPHPECALAPFETIKRTASCSVCSDRLE